MFSPFRVSTVAIASFATVVTGFLGNTPLTSPLVPSPTKRHHRHLNPVKTPSPPYSYLKKKQSNPRRTPTAYAIYFDHKRQTDPEFRKALKRESRKEARAAKEKAEAYGQKQLEAIKFAVRKAREEGFPSAVEDKEAYFMNEVGKGEILCQDGMYSPICSLKVFYLTKRPPKLRPTILRQYLR